MPEPDSSAAIAVPPINWNAAAAEAARNYARKDEQGKRNLGPTEGQDVERTPYLAGVPYKAGQYERLQNGVDIYWYTDLCYYEFDPAQGRNFRTVCKVRSAAERLSMDLAEKLEEATKPTYLGGKRSLPQQDDSGIRIP